MSRSRRRTPIFGNACCNSEKKFKTQSHKALRQAWRKKFREGDETPADMKEVMNIWDGPKDGKNWWKDYEDKDMRK